MKKFLAVLGIAMVAAALTIAQPSAQKRDRKVVKLNHSHVGIYGALFDFCDFSVFKFTVTDDKKQLEAYRQMVHEAHKKGKFNLVGIYGIKEGGFTSPNKLESFKRGAEQILSALDLNEVYCVFIDEENVTWGGGLETLNAAYEHIKKRFNIPVYQWLTMPDVPHPKLKADGFIWDFYWVRKHEFRKGVMKYLVTGKPLIMCINASLDVAPFEEPLTGFESSQGQVDVCMEFNIPMFFFAVDPIYGSPYQWLQSDDPRIVKWRSWCFRVIEQAKEIDVSKLPFESANFSAGQPIEVAGDAQNKFVYREAFEDLKFIDDATIHGFLNIRYDGEKELLYVPTPKEKPVTAQLIYYFFSMFDLHDVSAKLVGEVESGTGSFISLELSTDGQKWEILQKQPLTSKSRQAKSEKIVPVNLTITNSGEAALKLGKHLWVRVTMHCVPSKFSQRGCVLKEIVFSGSTLPPKERQIVLSPHTGFHYRDDFNCQRYLHLAEIENVEHLEFRRGYIGTHGVEGRGNVVILRHKFVSKEPLTNIKVRMQSTAHERNFAAHNELAISLDGKTKLLQATTLGKEGNAPYYSGIIEIDASKDERFKNVREFWVHLEMHNNCGLKTGTSNLIDWFEVKAEQARN